MKRATELDNVSKACRIVGYSRQQCYEIRRNYQTYGAEELLDYRAAVNVLSRCRPGAAGDVERRPNDRSNALPQRSSGNRADAYTVASDLRT